MSLVPLESAQVRLLSNGRRSRWDKVDNSAKKYKWGPIDNKRFKPLPYLDIPVGFSPYQVEKFLAEQRYEDLYKKIRENSIEIPDEDLRQPSPPIQYDSNGTAINKLELKSRQVMIEEYNHLIEYLIKHLNGFTPPSDYKRSKKVKKIMIPNDKFPDYNFMGLIIGPRGCNHKRLEQESGSLISLRGRGTQIQKAGKKVEQSEDDSIMPMHVHISADTEEALNKAIELIEPLLDPFHPQHELYKKKGLEQLAIVNGTNFAVDKLKCAICGATNHITPKCPDAGDSYDVKRADIKCGICGDRGHVTMDCKMGKASQIMGSSLENERINQEYDEMMKEISVSLQGKKLIDERGNRLDVSDESKIILPLRKGSEEQDGVPSYTQPKYNYYSNQFVQYRNLSNEYLPQPNSWNKPHLLVENEGNKPTYGEEIITTYPTIPHPAESVNDNINCENNTSHDNNQAYSQIPNDLNYINGDSSENSTYHLKMLGWQLYMAGMMPDSPNSQISDNQQNVNPPPPTPATPPISSQDISSGVNIYETESKIPSPPPPPVPPSDD